MKKLISCAGVAEIVRYNKMQYVVAAVVIFALGGFTWYGARSEFPTWIIFFAAVGLFLATWWTFASLLASWWIYDLSDLRRWDWLQRLVPPQGKTWLYVHTGLDECGYQFRKQDERGQGVIIDTYSPAVMTEPSIKIARAGTALIRRPDAACRWDAWPVRQNCFNICYFILAAHELRDRAERLGLFNEAARSLAQGGKLVLVEHARDFLNFLAFGPGFTHFWPTAEWDSLAGEAGLTCTHKGRKAGFIITRVYAKEQR